MKKGFTIIEIIICIGLIILVGTISIVSFNIVKNKEVTKALSKKSEDILTATTVYVETNNDIKDKLYSSKNGVAIPLKQLEKQGLIDFEGINIEDEYIVTMLGSEVPGEECVSTYTLKSWEFPEDKVIYICTSDNTNSLTVKEELTQGDGYYIAKGENPSNYVKFPVTSNTSNAAYFQNDAEKDLWRIVSIDNDGKIKLVYNKAVGTNNELLLDKTRVSTYNSLNYYQLIGSSTSSYYYRYSSNTIWTIGEVNNDNEKKENLLNNIVNRNWLIKSKYSFSYTALGSGVEFMYTNPKTELEMGIITQDEYRESLLFNETWIPTPFIVGSTSANFTSYALFINASGTIGYATQSQKAASSRYILGGSEYLPVIVLNSKVEIKKDSSCINSGTKDCPYLLECKDC